MKFIKSKTFFWVGLTLILILSLYIAYLSFVPKNTSSQNTLNTSVTPTNFASSTKLTLVNGNLTKELNIEIADTIDEQMQGLMNRKELPENYGMLFIFSESREQSFWMKDTYIPLDMIFFDENKNFVSVQKNAEPCLDKGYFCPSYKSNGRVLYVLEVKAGGLNPEFYLSGVKFDLN